MQNWFTKPCAEHMATFWSRQRAPLIAVITPSTSKLMLKIMSVIARQKTIWDICKSISSISTFELNRLDAETITKIPPNKLTLALPITTRANISLPSIDVVPFLDSGPVSSHPCEWVLFVGVAVTRKLTTSTNDKHHV